MQKRYKYDKIIFNILRKFKKSDVMTITKHQVLELIRDMPEEVDIDEIIYRLYLRQKLEAAEKDVREGRVISHEEVIRETSQWFEK